jgi:hypothetical protein
MGRSALDRQPRRVRPRLLTWLGSGTGVWAGFVVVHIALVILGSTTRTAGYVWGDVELYQSWVLRGITEGIWPVFHEPWVYPVGALLPIGIAGIGVPVGSAGYLITWVGLVVTLNAVVVVALLARQAHRAATWWLIFLLLLGPISISRLDAVICPLILLALLYGLTRPAVAAALLTVGAWIKVVPGAVYLALVALRRNQLRSVLVPGVVISGGVVAITWLGGGLSRITSFLTEQADRGLQIESVAATPWMFARLWSPSDLERNTELFTYEVPGAGPAALADALDPLLLVLLVGVLWLVIRAPQTDRTFVLASLVILTGLIVTNKVGSPQFVAWLGPPITAGIAWLESREDKGWPSEPGWSRLASLALVIAFCTQLIYPWGYSSLLEGAAPMTLVLALRNVLIVVMFIVALVQLGRSGRRHQAELV